MDWNAPGSEGVREILLMLDFLLPVPLPLAIEDSVLDRESMRFASFPGDGEDGEVGVTASNIWDRSRGVRGRGGGGSSSTSVETSCSGSWSNFLRFASGVDCFVDSDFRLTDLRL
jgi:hypothetical protein